jgi:hypothetical protein
MTTAPPSLFGICPACHQPSAADGLACPACVEAARPFIRRADGTAPADAEIAALLGEVDPDGPESPLAGDTAPVVERPASVVEAPGPPAVPERKQNQQCWVCEERRTCTPDPDNPGRWICGACRELS